MSDVSMYDPDELVRANVSHDEGLVRAVGVTVRAVGVTAGGLASERGGTDVCALTCLANEASFGWKMSSLCRVVCACDVPVLRAVVVRLDRLLSRDVHLFSALSARVSDLVVPPGVHASAHVSAC